MNSDKTRFMFGDRTYDFIKRLVQVLLPALASLYFGLASIWDLPNAEQVVGTSAVITTFLGVALGISSKQYEESGAAYDGNLVITSPEVGPKQFILEVAGDPEELSKKDAIAFKVETAFPTTEEEL